MDIHKDNCSLQPRYSMRNRVQNSSGFTLIEVLLVMSIIAILAALSISGFANAKDKARVARAMSEIRMLEKEIAAYAAEKAANPPQLVDINRATALDPNVSTLLDPWGIPYVYSFTPTRTNGGPFINSDFDLYSSGPDITSAGASIVVDVDDIIRGNDGRFVGSAYRYGL